MTFWYGSGSADPCLSLMDLDPNPANLLRTLFVAKSRSWGKAAFYVWRWCWVKILEQKKEVLATFWSRSESRIRILIRIRDSNPDPNLKLTSGRIRILNRIRNFCFDSARNTGINATHTGKIYPHPDEYCSFSFSETPPLPLWGRGKETDCLQLWNRVQREIFRMPQSDTAAVTVQCR